MSSRFIPPFYDVGSGVKPSSGAQLFFFQPDGVTPKDTFSDQLSTPTANANPVIANSNGVFGDIYIDGGYKITLKDKNGSQIFGGVVIDEFSGSNDLTVPYIFPTVAAFKDSLIEFPVGKTIHLDDRDADFKVVAGTAGINGFNLIGSTSVSQSIDLIVENNLVYVNNLGVVVGADGTLAVQSMLDQGFKYFYFPADNSVGQYIISSLSVSHGDWFLSNGAYLIQPVVPNFTRMFTTFANGYVGTQDSDPFVLKGFTIDGNRAAQGTYLGFEKEQSALVFLSAGSSFQQGRLSAIIEDCTFKETTADGISVHRQVDLRVDNCNFDNCFRGSLTLTGGGSEIRASNLKGFGDVHPSAHQIEVDSSGFDGNRSSKLHMVNSTFAGGFDVAVQLSVGESDARSDWFYSNCDFGTQDGQPFNVNGNDMAILRAVNCKFGIGTDASRIFRPGDSKFTGCDFMFNSTADVISFIQPGTDDGISTFSGQRLKFLNCEVHYDSSFAPDAAFVISAATNVGNKLTLDTSTDHDLSIGDFVFIDRVTPKQYSGNFLVTAVGSTTQFQVLTAKSYGAAVVSSSTGAKRKNTYGFSFSADDAVLDNLTTIESCDFPPEANYSFYLSQGGKVISKNNNINSSFGYFFSTAGTRAFDVTINGNDLLEDARGYANIGASVNTGNRLKHQNTLIEESKSVMWTVSNFNFIGPTGQRIIDGTTPSNTINASSAGLLGDEWRIETPLAGNPYSYVCRVNNITTQSANWLVLSSL